MPRRVNEIATVIITAKVIVIFLRRPIFTSLNRNPALIYLLRLSRISVNATYLVTNYVATI